ncbi:hypothetical protein CK203_036785 [Vitis vinifera]|uniref:Endonuclease/exonuclease/phosphatase domain-containing protein n=1 Tax=Vitis vinifera TaxID=29760 RepID=A0A438I0I2_VITVI|nr:hypothetical protein CK203_036785 [Vitis vinifera]
MAKFSNEYEGWSSGVGAWKRSYGSGLHIAIRKGHVFHTFTNISGGHELRTKIWTDFPLFNMLQAFKENRVKELLGQVNPDIALFQETKREFCDRRFVGSVWKVRKQEWAVLPACGTWERAGIGRESDSRTFNNENLKERGIGRVVKRREGLDWSPISTESVERLDQPFLEEEIHNVVFQLNKEKVPRSDGYTIALHQECWDVVKEDLLNVFSKFHNNEIINQSINATFIALVLKKSLSRRTLDFRPISLVTNLYKIITKNRTGDRTGKVTGSRFTGRTGGRTAIEPVTS